VDMSFSKALLVTYQGFFVCKSAKGRVILNSVT
jgi:hypothetical protein